MSGASSGVMVVRTTAAAGRRMVHVGLTVDHDGKLGRVAKIPEIKFDLDNVYHI